MKQDNKFSVFLHSSTSLSKIEKHVRKNATLYKSTDWREANNLLGMEYNIYILHKETKDSDTLGKLIRQRHPGALIVLVTSDPVVTQDSLDKYFADYSLAEDPARAGLLSMIPSCRKLREVRGEQDQGQIADVIPMHVESPETILKDGSGSAWPLEQDWEAESPVTKEFLRDSAADQYQRSAAAEEPNKRGSLRSALAAFFTGLKQSVGEKKGASGNASGNDDMAAATSGSRNYLVASASIFVVILLALGVGVFAQGSHKQEKKAEVRKAANASKTKTKTKSSAPAETPSETSKDASPEATLEPATVAPVHEDVGSKTVAPALAPDAPPVDVNHAPSVSISGPTLVTVGQTVTYHANASDPDGDSLSYSWGSSSKSTAFQNTGTFPVSVTVTDSAGLSASATIMVTVRQ